ncbi:MAG TPA: hypothetical protein VF841_03960 [Anaeromyxobacter sp.]
MSRPSKLVLAACAAVVLAACTDPSKLPAEAALKAADSAFDAVKTQAQKLVPTQTEALARQIAEAKGLYAAQKYKEALASAGAAADKAKALGAAAAAKRDELTNAFRSATAELPPLLDSVKARIAELKKTRKLPKGLDKAAVERAEASLSEIAASSETAAAKFKDGALQEAAAAARALPAKAQELLASIGGGEKVATK